MANGETAVVSGPTANSRYNTSAKTGPGASGTSHSVEMVAPAPAYRNARDKLITPSPGMWVPAAVLQAPSTTRSAVRRPFLIHHRMTGEMKYGEPVEIFGEQSIARRDRARQLSNLRADPATDRGWLSNNLALQSMAERWYYRARSSPIGPRR